MSHRIQVPAAHVATARALLTAAEQKACIKDGSDLIVRFDKLEDAQAFTWLMKDEAKVLLGVTEGD